ncbi:hypothetical protein BGZ83_009413 [Gryganskiella cystojenkinii]|nr:hypothetical protein BGZ83_009413 [Gryganskiella cystojenkinii]
MQDLTIEESEPIETERHAHLWMIENCLHLVRLRWSISNKITGGEDEDEQEIQSAPMALLSSSIVTKKICRQLETICLPGMEFDLEDFEILVAILTRLTELDLSDTNFGDSEWQSLRKHPRHLGTLRVVVLEGCLDLLSSGFLQDMLCSLPALDVFKADTIVDTDTLNDCRTWVCLGLRELKITIELKEPSSLQMFQYRISKLIKLEKCLLYRPTSGSFRMTLEGGLDKLKTLRRLRVFMRSPRGDMG